MVTASTVISLILWLVIANLTVVVDCFPTFALLVLVIAIQNKKLFVMPWDLFFFFDGFGVEIWMLSFQVTN